MKNNIKILAIETSCDETAAAIVDCNIKSMQITPLSSVVFSQIDLHKKYGGVFPELASREHIQKIMPVVKEALFFGQAPNSKKQVTNKFQITNSKLQTASHPHLSASRSALIRDIDVIAVTTGPGLIGSLIVGVEFARGLAMALDKPVIPINHLEGHIYANFVGVSTGLSLRGTPKQSPVSSRPERRDPLYLPDEIASSVITPPPRITDYRYVARRNDIPFPALALIVSGGHTLLVLMKDHLDYEIIGTTLDDAAGECFDKIARMLGLPYPGGPALSKLAEKGSATAFDFPRSMLNSGDFNFSFSGLKTAVFYKLRDLGLVNDKAEPIAEGEAPITKQQITNKSQNSNHNNQTGVIPTRAEGSLTHSGDDLGTFGHRSSARADVAASAQQAIVDVLVKKTYAAAKQYKVRSILVGGGVSANSTLRQAFGCHPDRSNSEAEGSLTHSRAFSVPVYLSPLELTGDNALSIAIAACCRYQNGDVISWIDLEANSSLKLK